MIVVVREKEFCASLRAVKETAWLKNTVLALGGQPQWSGRHRLCFHTLK